MEKNHSLYAMLQKGNFQTMAVINELTYFHHGNVLPLPVAKKPFSVLDHCGAAQNIFATKNILFILTLLQNVPSIVKVSSLVQKRNQYAILGPYA